MNTNWSCTKYTPQDEYKGKVYIELCVSRDKSESFAIRTYLGDCISKSLKLVGEPLPSNRTEFFFKRCRFSTLLEAQEIYEKWKAKGEKY
jgi:hypothetical protein